MRRLSIALWVGVLASHPCCGATERWCGFWPAASRRPSRPPRRARQIHPLAWLDAMRAAQVSAVGGVDALVAPAGAVVPLRDAPQRVALLDHIPPGQFDLSAGRLAAARSSLRPLRLALGPGFGGDAGSLAASLRT